MGGSEEYLAALGFDTSDVDKAVNQTITLLGHLGNQFDQLQRPVERAERALSGTARASRAAGDAAKAQVSAERERNRQLEVSSKQTAIYNQYLYDQERAVGGANGNLARLRYAVYDVSNALAIGGAAALAFTAGIIGANVSYEREFADVRRTVGVTGQAADDLYDRFIRLSTQIPVAFSSLTEIGTLAGQLGVLEDRVASFTQTVAQFSATTDVSVEASATAFGRLDELIDGVDGQYNRLASSILNVGINSVATESQIIAIASQIAATGNQAGLTADEIIGLSGSLASLGVAPEAARGTILRVFSQINSAIAQGGTRLNDFAAISGMTAAQFRQNWSTDFTSTFVAFLQGIDENGTGAETALRSLGITATRDVNAMLKLSQNSEAVADNLALAAVGFNDVSILADNFGIIAETNASRLQILVQTVMAFAATVGEATNGPLAAFLDYLQRVLESLVAFAQTPLGQGISFFTTILGASLAVMLLVGAAALRTAGSFLALKTAIGETYLQTMLAQGGMRGFTASLFGAAGGAAALSAALKATGVGLLITGGLYLLGEVIAGVNELMKTGEQRAEEYFGSLDGLSEALKSDNSGAFQQLAEEQKAALTDAATTGGSWVAVLEAAARAQDELASNTDAGSGAIDAQTLRIGENTQEWLRNALASNENFREIFANIDALNQLTSKSLTFGDTTITGFQPFDVEAYTQALIEGGQQGGQAYIEAFRSGVEQAAIAQGADAQTVAAIQDFLTNNESLVAAEEAGREVTNALTAGMTDAAQDTAIGDILDSVFGEIEPSSEEASAAFRTLIDDIYQAENASAALSDATAKLGQDFAQNGAEVASSGSAMQAVISQIYASSAGSADAAARLQGFFNALVQGGYASAQQLAGLQAIISSLTGGKGTSAIPFDMSGFTKGVTTAGRAAGGAARQVRTLTDYAGDLAKVMDRAFDIRFGGRQALDSITSGWQAIRDAVAETNEQIAEHQAKMQQLSADKAVREYWLSVAENYGDTLRAGLLRAEIAELDADLASTSRDLTDAQAKNSKTLVGNSKAAIQNRAEILDLVEGYQDYIQALAASGVPQDQLRAKAAQLKADFLAQATQLGYNVNELGIYGRAFDDVSLAIGRVPRNITVAANTNPALQALNELEAKARSLGGQSFPGPKITNPTIAKEVRRMALEAAISARSAWILQLIRDRNYAGANNAELSVTRMRQQLLSGSYRTGTAWTGSGNPWEPAGIVHNREAVLNETATSMVPPSWINAWNQGRSPVVSMPSPTVAGGDSGPVDLGPYTLRRLEEIMGTLSVIIGDQAIGEATDRYHERVRSAGG